MASSFFLKEQEFRNFPDCTALIVHGLGSTANDGGLRTVLSFDKKPILVDHLGLPTQLEDYNLLAFVQVCDHQVSFVEHKLASKKMTMSVNDYLGVYQFFLSHWSLVSSKLLHQVQAMRDSSLGIRLENNLTFHSNGTSSYKARVGEEVFVLARIHSQDSVADRIYVKLEKGNSQLELPLSTTVKLFSDPGAYDILQKLAYKPLSKKKIKLV